VNFLPVGHTHEDIDAFFGVYSKHLDKLDVYTVIGRKYMAIHARMVIVLSAEKTTLVLLQVCYDTDVACTPVFLNMVSEKHRKNLAPDAYVYLDKLGMSSY